MGRKRIDPKLPIPNLQTGSSTEKQLFAPDQYGDRLYRRLDELFREIDGTVSVYDEGTYLGEADGLNFVGTAVTAVANTTLPGVFDIDVSASGGTGTTLDTLSVTASEDVAAGALINIWNSSGTAKGRNADASKGLGYEAHGWTDSAVTSGNTITVRFLGKNTHSSGLTAGPVYLGNTGLATSTPPSTAGYLSQEVGAAESATSFAFEWHADILIAAAHAVSNGGTTQSQTFTTNNTYTVGTGAGWLTMIGGGGGGKSTANAAAAGGGGGGAGEYCQNLMIPFTAGETITISIGAGGAAGSNGGTTSVLTSFGTYSVLGGNAAPSGTGGAGGGPRGGAGGGAGNPAGAGTLGTAETPCHFGGSSGGGGATVATTGVAAAGGGGPGNLTGGAAGTTNSHGGGGGGGGASPWGVGGAGGAGNAGGSNAPASSYGSGGGGAGGNDATGQTGGTGANGVVVLMYVA